MYDREVLLLEFSIFPFRRAQYYFFLPEHTNNPVEILTNMSKDPTTVQEELHANEQQHVISSTLHPILDKKQYENVRAKRYNNSLRGITVLRPARDRNKNTDD